MIKVNLLESVTDRAEGVAVVESRVSKPQSQTMLLVIGVGLVLLLGMAVDWFSAHSAYNTAQVNLEREEEIAVRMAAINREQAELEQKVKDIQLRIDAIKKLRASQRGPVAVLSAINERMPNIPDFRLTSIEQKAGELIIEGHSPNESAVTQFGRSLEFSSGLFTNVNMEIERRTLDVNQGDYRSSPGPNGVAAPKAESVRFKIVSKYTEPSPEPSAAPVNTISATLTPTQLAQSQRP